MTGLFCLVALSLPAAEGIKALPGFQVEQIYKVPANQGSWISMAFDAGGNMFASDEKGPIYRLQLGQSKEVIAQRLAADVGSAHGLLHAFDSLYAVVGGPLPHSGVFRIKDPRGDGSFDEVEELFPLAGGGEHGPHGMVLGPEKKWIYLVAGNGTRLPPEITRDLVAGLRGARDHSPPGAQGWVMRFSPDGKQRELVAIGLRNAYDIARSPAGELFTFDSDNEGFMGLPWYRPANLYHVTSGADFGWRQSSDNLPPFAPDNLPPVLEVGPGSPTGVVFGTGAKFPAKYQQALYLCDWSYGRIYAVHLTPQGASYRGKSEFFLSGRPLPATDIQVGPDGALYFTTGGRGARSAVFRVTWQDPLPVEEKQPRDLVSKEQKLRRTLERFHGRQHPQAVTEAWQYLRHEDRHVRFAARTAIEHQPVDSWVPRAVKERDVQAKLEAMVAVARQHARSDVPVDFPGSEVLSELKWDTLSSTQQLQLLRCYELLLGRGGLVAAESKAAILAQIDSSYPSYGGSLDRALSKILTDLGAANLVDRTLTCLERTSSAMQQIHFLRQLGRLPKKNWSVEQRNRLRESLALEEILITAAQPYPDVKELLQSLLADTLAADSFSAKLPPPSLVKEWTFADLAPALAGVRLDVRHRQAGQAAFRKARCHTCHRVAGTGGVLGPSLNGLAGRYNRREILEAIVNPDKIISDQFRTTLFVLKDGRQLTGQIVDYAGGELTVRTDPLQPFARTRIPEQEIEETYPSERSLMPRGLLNTLTKEEILNLLAFLIGPVENVRR